jgi:hypothetical protein
MHTTFARYIQTITLALFCLCAVTANAQQPSIASFAPTTGAVGRLVTITGTNLSNTTAISIGGVAAILISNSANSVVAMVMPGATTGTVLLTTAGGTVSTIAKFTVTATKYPSEQQGGNLSDSGGAGAISADGNTAIIVNSQNNDGIGGIWIFTRSGGGWTQQGSKLIGSGSIGSAFQGSSVSISADGNTVIVGGPGDDSSRGAAWIFTRSGGVWTQQGNKLVGTGAVGTVYLPESINIPGAEQGASVSLSADGNTAIVGGPTDNNYFGAAWIFTRSGGVWVQQGGKLVGTGTIPSSIPAYNILWGAEQGGCVSLSADGNTAFIGGPVDDSTKGAVWVFTRSGGVWTQQGNKLVGGFSENFLSEDAGIEYQGSSISLSADGNTAIVNSGLDGYAWVFTRNEGVWTQQGNALLFPSAPAGGGCVSISADGNTALWGGYIYTRSGGIWTQQVNLSSGPYGNGSLNTISPDGNMAVINGENTNGQNGVWIYISPTPPPLPILLNPYPSMVNDDGTLSTDLTDLDITDTVKGVVTDGVSKVLLYVASSSAVTFTLANSNLGLLSSLGGSDFNNTVTVPSVNGQVVAVYTSPDGYGTNNISSATVNTVDAQNNTSSVSIQLQMPPVLLVHGMWSSPAVWTSGGFENYLVQNGISSNIYLVDYSKYSSQTFDPKDPESLPARNAIFDSVIQAIRDDSAMGIVATQVDIVGHSLGGLQARSFSQDDRFESSQNYNQGYFHKLITIGTPHMGSEWGAILYDANAVNPSSYEANLRYSKNGLTRQTGNIGNLVYNRVYIN